MNYENSINGLIKQLKGISNDLMEDEFPKCVNVVKKAATALSTLQTENERMRATVDSWKKKYVEANGKWIEVENKWAGLDKAVRNGNVYRPMQEELKLTHEENQSLKDANENLRDELEQVKRERDVAIEQLHGHCPACAHYTPNHNEGLYRFCCFEVARNTNVEINDNWEWRG